MKWIDSDSSIYMSFWFLFRAALLTGTRERMSLSRQSRRSRSISLEAQPGLLQEQSRMTHSLTSSTHPCVSQIRLLFLLSFCNNLLSVSMWPSFLVAVSDDPEAELDDDTQTLLTSDFEIGHYIRERIVPRAVLYFTGMSCTKNFCVSNLNVQVQLMCLLWFH